MDSQPCGGGLCQIIALHLYYETIPNKTMSNTVPIVLIVAVSALIFVLAMAFNGTVSTQNAVDKMNCQQLRDYINYALEHRYDLSVITDSTYANKRLAANCLH